MAMGPGISIENVCLLVGRVHVTGEVEAPHLTVRVHVNLCEVRPIKRVVLLHAEHEVDFWKVVEDCYPHLLICSCSMQAGSPFST